MGWAAAPSFPRQTVSQQPQATHGPQCRVPRDHPPELPPGGGDRRALSGSRPGRDDRKAHPAKRSDRPWHVECRSNQQPRFTGFRVGHSKAFGGIFKRGARPVFKLNPLRRDAEVDQASTRSLCLGQRVAMSLVGNASRKDDPSPWIAPGQCGNFDHALRIVVQGDLAPVLRDVDVDEPRRA